MGSIKMKGKNAETVFASESETVAQTQQNEIAEETQMRNAGEYDDPAVRHEDETKTDEHSRLYYLNNGTAKCVISAAPVNFFDEEEKKWKTVDNTLVESGDAFVTKAGECKTEISKAHVKKSVKVHKKDKEIAWTFLGKQSASAPCALTAQSRQTSAPTVLQVENKADRAARHASSRAVYENAETQTDLEYCVHGSGVKENIIVKEKSDEYRYLFALDANGLSMRLSEDNTQIELYSDEKTEFIIPAPYMFDANGAISDEVYYELDPVDNGGYIFAVVADAAWINADERALPVTIDPQIVTDTEPIITKRTEYRYSLGSSCGCFSDWRDAFEHNIHVSGGNSMQYRTQITVRRSVLNKLNNRVASVKLLLSPMQSNSGYLYIDGKRTYYNGANGKLAIDLTSRFKNKPGNFSFWLEPDAADFYFSMSNEPPVLEVEYFTNDNRRSCMRTFALTDTAEADYDVLTGELNARIAVALGEGLTVPYNVSVIHKASKENFACGNGFRLNLHERLEKNGDTATDADYVYTDELGIKYGFWEKFYRISDEDCKISVDKSEVTVHTDGTLTDGSGNEVFKEEVSATGWKASTKLEGVKNIELFEQRQQEIKQLEEQVEAYENTLQEYVVADAVGEVLFWLKSYYTSKKNFDDFIAKTYSNYLMTESEAYSLMAMCLQSEPNAAVEKQKQYICNRNEQNRKLLKRYYKEYVNKQDELALRKKYAPVNYLTDGSIIKGYNEYGDLVAIADGYQNTLMIERDKSNRIKRIYDDKDNVVSFAYNGKGLLTAVTDVRGKRTALRYDTNGNLTGVTYADGRTVSITANASLLTKVQSSEKTHIELTYNSNLLALLTQSSMAEKIAHGHVTDGKVMLSKLWIEYGENKTTIREMISAEKKEEYRFDTNGNCREYLVEENGKVVKAEQYDYEKYARDNTQYAKKDSLYKTSLAQYSFVAGESISRTLNEYNEVTQETTGWKTLYEGVDTSDTVKQQTVTQYVYDNERRVIEERATVTTQKRGENEITVAVKKHSYNAQGNVVRTESYVEGEEVSEGIAIEEKVYDEKGRAIKEISYNSLDSSSKFYTESEYDENGKVTAEIDETGENKTQLSYVDGASIVKSKTLPNGSKFAYGYDGNDTVTAITQSTECGEENSTQTAYTCGAVTKLTSGNNTVEYVYDSKKRKTGVTLNGTKYVMYAYADKVTENGATVNKVTATLCNGDTAETVTDTQGNVLRISYNSVPQVSAVYNARGELQTRTDRLTNETATYSYDKLDRVTGITCGNVSEQIVYNDYGQVAKKTLQVNGAATEYAYAYKNNAAKELESVTVGGITVLPQSDCLGRNTGKKIKAGGKTVASETIAYRKVGDHATNMPSAMRFGNHVATAEDKTQFVQLDNLKYVYDNCGNISETWENGKLAAKYTYDSLNRLIREDNKQLGNTTLFTYDNNGNILCKRVFAFTLKDKALLEETPETQNVSYAYSGDRLLSFGSELCEYDVLGNPITYRGKACTWDKGRQLTEYKMPQKNGGYKTVTFTYDGQGRRISKTVDGTTTNHTYDSNGNLIKQADGTNTLAFVYDHSGIVGVKHNNATYVYRRNAQGDIIALLDNTGAVVVKYVYNAWGNHSVYNANGNDITYKESNENTTQYKNHIGNLNPYRYRGYYFDVETRLYFLKTRYYDFEVGRFITIDDLSYLDPETINGLNLYAYCVNNPVMNVDPNGTWSWKKFWKAIGAAVLVVAVVAATVVTAGAVGGIVGAALMVTATGVGIGAAVGGVSAAINGTDIAGGILGGAIKGGAVGAAVGLGIMTGGGAFSVGGGLLAMGGAVAINFGAGMLKYAIDNGMNGKPMNAKDAFASGGLQALSGLFAFGAGTIIGIAGYYNVPKMTKMFSPQWFKNLAVSQFIKALFYHPFDFIFSYLQKSFFSGGN